MKWGILIPFILLTLMVYSSTEHNERDPDMEYILKNFEKYNNTQVTFVGKVINLDEEIEINLMEPPYASLTIQAKNVSVERGDVIEITGILDGEKHVTAIKVIISKGWKYNLIFIRSIPAIPFALYFFLRRWKFNVKKFKFEGKNA